MKQILFENACVRPQSRTLQLTRELLKHIEGNVQEVALYDEGLAPVDLVQLTKRNELLAVDDYKAPLFKYARNLPKPMKSSSQHRIGIWRFRPSCVCIWNM